MILPFNADRSVTRVAARGHRSGRQPEPPDVVGPPAALGRRLGPPRPLIEDRGSVPSGPRRGRLERLITTAVVGEPEQLSYALTEDAVGWSPSLSYSSRAEASSMLRDHVSPLLVTEFHVDRLMGPSPFLIAEWHLAAVHAEAFLVDDDVLVEVCDEPVHLVGTSVAKLRDHQIEAVHTYYDEALLVEQVILGVKGSETGDRMPPFPF